MSKFDKVKKALGLDDDFDEEMTPKPVVTIPTDVTVSKPEPKPEPKPAPTPKAEPPKPEPKPAPTPKAEPPKPERKPEPKNPAYSEEDMALAAQILNKIKAGKEAEAVKSEQPAMKAALDTLVAFAEKDEKFATKFYKAAKKFAPKVYGTFYKIGDQLISTTCFSTLPEGITPEVYEIRDNKPHGKPLSAEKAAPILERLLQR